MLTIGVIKTSLKENERRVPIHPGQLGWIPEGLRRQMIFEKGYGIPFGVEDSTIAPGTGGLLERDEVFDSCDVVIIAKPVREDLEKMREKGIIWGWLHFVQQGDLTQLAIERCLTAIAFESMHHWEPDGGFRMHVFHKNNEIAGYAGVLDGLRLLGITGYYGPVRRAIVLSFGSVSRGAVYALRGLGFEDVTVLVIDVSQMSGRRLPGVHYREIKQDDSENLLIFNSDGSSFPLIEELATADIIINGICQNPNHPLMFVRESEIDVLKPGCLIIDISCDRGMGFPFAHPTTFEQPMVRIGEINYYAVDHTPSYLWDSASWEISRSLIPFLPVVAAGPGWWNDNQTIHRAIEINSGVIQNQDILAFQRRSPRYPHITAHQ